MNRTTPAHPLRLLGAAVFLAVSGLAQAADAEAQKPVATRPAPPLPTPPLPAPQPRSAPAAPAAQSLPRAAFIANMDAEFRKRDADGDGKITRAELEQWERARAYAAAQTRNREAFARLDTDHDGKLSASEFAALVREPAPVDVGPLMARFDPNHDQVITLIEFRAGTLTNFDRLDSDHDGVISPAEMKASAPAPATKSAGR